MLVASLVASSLFLSPIDRVPSLVPPLMSGAVDVAGAGAGEGGAKAFPVGPAIASTLVGILGSGVLTVGALATADVGFPGLTALIALALDWGLQALVPSLFGVPRSLASSGIGMLGGLVFGAAGGALGGVVGRASNQGGGFADIAGVLLGIFIGFALGPPIVTVLDPFGLSSELVAGPSAVSSRVLDARPVEAAGVMAWRPNS